MRIFHLITSIEKGGAENHLVSLIEDQKKNGYEICVFYSKNKNYWYKKLSSMGVKVYTSANKKNYRIINFFYELFLLNKLVKKFKPNIVHAHLPYMEILSFFIILLNRKIKLVITKHLDSGLFEGSNYKNNGLLSSIVQKIINKKASKIISISKSVKKFFIRGSNNLERSKFKIIYYGIDILKKKRITKINEIKSFKKKYKINNKTLVYGTIARLVKQKSLKTLLDSFKKLKEKNNKKIILIIVGSGPLKLQLKNYAKDIGIESRVIWIDYIEDVSLFYQSIDIFCLSSLYEGLGLVLLEAMMHKKPIISSNVSAIPEIVTNKQNGLLFKVKDSQLMFKAMEKLFNKKKRNKYGLNGFERIKTQFTTQKMFEETDKIYKSLFSKI